MTSQDIHLVSAFPTGNFGGKTVRVADLNGDGAPELLITQAVYGQRSITCQTAVSLHGEVLWQVGKPAVENGDVYCDLPVQVYDWDGDGRNEVLYIKQAGYAQPILYEENERYREHKICERAARYEGHATLVVLDAQTGQQKATLPMPAAADDCLLFADLTGRGRRQDLIVKDRYWNMWGVSHEGDVLWHWKGSAGHFPAVADIDGDGRDEVFVGYALLDHDGSELFVMDWPGWGDGKEDDYGVPVHQDATYVCQLNDGSWRLLIGNGGIHCLDATGRELWHHLLVFEEAQHVVVGRFSAETELQAAVIDRGYPRTAEGDPACLYLFDVETGRELWRRPQLPGGWVAACMKVCWSDPRGLEELLVYNRGTDAPAAIYDGRGDIVAEFPDPPDGYCRAADVWGDSRDEVILGGPSEIRIYANRRPLAVPTLYNSTVYHGM